MKIDKEQSLIERFPKLFQDNGKDGTCMKFGACIEDGWHDILERVCQELESLRTMCPELKFLQIKEKFGALRIYVSGDTKEYRNFVYESILGPAEEESLKVCENCGSKENVETKAWNGHWLKTYCKTCGSDKKITHAACEKSMKLLEELVAKNKEISEGRSEQDEKAS